MKSYSKKGFARLIAAFGNSMKGLIWLIKHEAAFQQEILLSFILVPVIFMLDISDIERLALGFTIVFVLLMEIINTSIEAAIDRIGMEYHELSGLAKDLGSLIVLIAFAFGVTVWAVILY